LLARFAQIIFTKAGRSTTCLTRNTSRAYGYQFSTGAAEIKAKHAVALSIAHKVLHVEPAASTARNQSLPDVLARSTQLEDLLLADDIFQVALAGAQPGRIETQ
jgi:hypothetical protein